jgi:hypothetical protein
MDPELEELPTDLLRGLDFRVSKTAKGGFADYSTSKWARKETALDATEQAAIAEHGLYDLSTFLPKKPSEVEVKVIKEMFEASVDGQSYDAERWGAYFRPAGVNAPAGAPATTADEDTPAPVAKATPVPATTSSFDDEDDVPVASAPVQSATPGTEKKAEDILAMIRARQKQ